MPPRRGPRSRARDGNDGRRRRHLARDRHRPRRQLLRRGQEIRDRPHPPLPRPNRRPPIPRRPPPRPQRHHPKFQNKKLQHPPPELVASLSFALAQTWWQRPPLTGGRSEESEFFSSGSPPYKGGV